MRTDAQSLDCVETRGDSRIEYGNRLFLPLNATKKFSTRFLLAPLLYAGDHPFLMKTKRNEV